MTPTRYYATGYSGHTPEQLLRVAQVLDATVIDIRTNAASRNPAWGKWALVKSLGTRYRHIPALGNIHYKDPSKLIEIQDMDAGLEEVGEDKRGAVILLCGCRDSEWCHRTVVLDEICNRADEGNVPGYEEMVFEELDWSVESTHPQLPLITDSVTWGDNDPNAWKDGINKRIPQSGFSFLKGRFPDSDKPKDLYGRDLPPESPEIVMIDTAPMGETKTEQAVARGEATDEQKEVIREVYRAVNDITYLQWKALRLTDKGKPDG